MASKIIIHIASLAVLIQISLAQVLPSAYTGNSYVENNVVVNGANGLGLASGANLAGANIAGANLAAANLAGANLAGVSNLANAATLANTANLGVTNVGIGSLSTAPGFINLASVSGGGVLPVTSYSPIAPGGLSVISDNAIEGNLVVTGELPFLSAVAFEGALNTDGAGAASCGCGSGAIGITNENYGSSLNGLGLGLGGVRGLGGLRL